MFNWLFGTKPSQPAVASPRVVRPNTKDVELATYHENWSINNFTEKDFKRIFKSLSFPDLLSCRLVCKKWRDILTETQSVILTEPNTAVAKVFPNIKSLSIDPSARTNAADLVAHLPSLTSLRCPVLKIEETTLAAMTNLKVLDCPMVKAPFGVECLSTKSIDNLGSFKNLTALTLIGISDKDLPVIGKLSALESLSISSKNFTGKIDSLVDVSKLVNLEISKASLVPEFFYNLYLFPHLEFIGFIKCTLPVSRINPQTPLSQLGPSDGFIFIIGCNSLRYLYLNESEITEYHIEVISRMEELIGLSLKGCKTLGDYMLNSFKNAPLLDSLEELNISETMVTHIGLQIISRFEFLRVLDISKCDGIKLLSPINDLENLEVLRMSENRINAETLQDGFKMPQEFLQELLLDAEPINDPLLMVIASKFPGLVKVDLRKSSVTSTGLDVLHNLTYLRYVDLSYTAVDDNAFEYLQNLAFMENLVMEKCLKVTGFGASKLTKVPGLRVLNMNGCKKVDISGVKEMSELSVQTLRLSGCELIGDEVWNFLSQMEELKRVDLSGTPVGDHGIQQIQKAKWLEVIYLSKTKVTDEGVSELLKCRLLRKIDVRGCNVVKQYKTACVIMTSELEQLKKPVSKKSKKEKVQKEEKMEKIEKIEK
ncbi:F-box/LRR-repeat protein, putative [Entamoeba invadens IP1]|uniref:F-box/LRR-repeat protein, putative n=1 Tax=Entamoeba invadens IP1 TaxID=370355 RepID=A0A0A1TUG2_ENTIV|nr:F-box/LRR-repeat protein, putative [Entamoeba invadens IP1]ELP83682.1 F-box/LRR-repeat protein, putative [Entamoeba invadens IP1]|eukprot:XP_004183028.1 F-box/LRR-repeat protein, putative [Entamoeba invadens IP1]